LCDYAEQRGVVRQDAAEYAIVASLLHHHFRERSKRGCAKMAPDANRVKLQHVTPHRLIVRERLVRPHRPDLVSEKTKLARPLDGFSATARAEL
jgi:hypothetical protein